jgi:hypothetical protein
MLPQHVRECTGAGEQIDAGGEWHWVVVRWCETRNDGASQMESTGGDSAYAMIFYIKKEIGEMQNTNLF